MYIVEHITREQAKRQVGEGWESLIDLAYDVFEEDPSLVVSTVKEKLGGLRIYLDSNFNPKLQLLLDHLEQESYSTCETCGERGWLREGPWMKTLCDEHSNGKSKLFNQFKEFIAPQLELFDEYNEL